MSDALPFKIEVAARVNRLPAYLFGRINALMYEKRRAGADVIDLGMGNPSDPPADIVVDKLVEAARDPSNHGYIQSTGILNLRREVASKYVRRHGVRLDPESQVVVCLGSKEGFSHMCLALMGPSDTAIVPSPSYPAHVYGVALASGNVIALEVANSQKFLANIAYVCQHLYPKPKLVILNFPHNPSAVTVDPEFFVEVVKLARRYNFMVLSDLAYGDIGFDGYQPPSFLAAPGAIELGVEFTTMSKGYNMAGWRVGFAAGNAEMLKALATVKAYYDYGMFLPIQVAAIMALRHTDAAVESQSQVYQRRRDVLCDGLKRLGWDITVPRRYVRVGQNPAPLDATDGLGSVCHEAIGGRGRRRQPRWWLRSSGRTLPPHVAGGERESVAASRTTHRALPGCGGSGRTNGRAHPALGQRDNRRRGRGRKAQSPRAVARIPTRNASFDVAPFGSFTPDSRRGLGKTCFATTCRSTLPEPGTLVRELTGQFHCPLANRQPRNAQHHKAPARGLRGKWNPSLALFDVADFTPFAPVLRGEGGRRPDEGPRVIVMEASCE